MTPEDITPNNSESLLYYSVVLLSGRFGPLQVGFRQNQQLDRECHVVPAFRELPVCDRGRSWLPSFNVNYFHNFWMLFNVHVIIGRNVRFGRHVLRRKVFGYNIRTARFVDGRKFFFRRPMTSDMIKLW